MSNYKCELCHKRNAKYQHFEADGQELYICGVCRNKRWAAFADELLKQLESIIPEKQRSLKMSEAACGEDQDMRLSAAIVMRLLHVKANFGKKTNVFMLYPVSLPGGQSISSMIFFIPTARKISLHYMVMEPDEESLSQFEWDFDVSDPKNGVVCGVKWKFTKCDKDEEQKFGIGDIPFEVWRQMLAVVSMVETATPKGSMNVKDYLKRKGLN